MQKKRIGLFQFYDEEGIAGGYIYYLLQEMCRVTDKLVVICNGKLSDDSRGRLKEYADDIFLRKDAGLDVGAYKDAQTDLIGWEELEKYDEVIFFNNTFYGPVSDITVMFDEMDQRPVDFWGVTPYFEFDFPSEEYTNEYGYCPEHISLYFYVIRKSMISSQVYQDYWTNLKEPLGYDEVIMNHEVVFTKKFEDFGFTWDTYINLDKYKTNGRKSIAISYFCSFDLIKNQKMPFIKRKAMVNIMQIQLAFGKPEQSQKVLEYLKSTKYNVDLIWDDLLKSYNLRDIYETLHLNCVLPEYIAYQKNIEKYPIALFMHLYYEENFDYCISYLRNLPECVDVYLTTDTENKKDKIQELITKKGLINKVSISVVMNRGRELSAFLVEDRRYIKNYKYFCHIQDKRAPYLFPTIAETVSDMMYESCLSSKEYVMNIINLFEKEKRLGCLLSNQTVYGSMEGVPGGIESQWGDNFENTKRLLKDLNIKVPIDEKKDPYILGTVGWFRTEAMHPLFEKEWCYEDFEEEPLPTDGTLSHAIERSVPYIAQGCGFYTATVLTERMAGNQLSGMEYMFRKNKLSLASVFPLEIKRQLTDFCKKNNRVAIYGAGQIAMTYTKYMEELNLEFEYYVVTEIKNNRRQLKGHDVISLNDLKKKDLGIIVALGSRNMSEVVPHLKKLGYTNLLVIE